MDKVKENVAIIRERVIKAAKRAGRDPKEILLCAASKTRTPEVIAESAKLDIDLFGENRVQELCRNFEAGAYLDKPLHFIGHLQSNKVKMLVGKCDVIQSVDSEKLLFCINTEAEKLGIIQSIMIEVNIGGEESKSGVTADDVWTLLDTAETLKNIKVVGLMTIPPRCETTEESRPYFRKMRELFDNVCEHGYLNLEGKYLSMGMSGDFEIAIEEGANIVRIGTAIFGEREYK